MARVKVSTVVHTEDGRHVWLSAGDEVPEDLVSLLAPALLDEPQNESVSPEVEESDTAPVSPEVEESDTAPVSPEVEESDTAPVSPEVEESDTAPVVKPVKKTASK